VSSCGESLGYFATKKRNEGAKRGKRRPGTPAVGEIPAGRKTMGDGAAVRLTGLGLNQGREQLEKKWGKQAYDVSG